MGGVSPCGTFFCHVVIIAIQIDYYNLELVRYGSERSEGAGDAIPDEDRMDEDEKPTVANDPNDLSQYNMDNYDEEESGGIGEYDHFLLHVSTDPAFDFVTSKLADHSVISRD